MSQSPEVPPPFDGPAPSSIKQSILVMILLVLVGILLFRNFDTSGRLNGPLVNRTVTPRGELGADEESTVELFENLKQSTVFIQTSQYNLDARRGFALRVEESPGGIGTGFVWDERGHIITNFHVIQEAVSASVQLADESVYPAAVVGISPDHDIAILKIDAPASKLKPIPVGSSGDLKVGQTVIALGYPYGLNLTLTKGVISGLGQTLPLQNGYELRDSIQTDASINPGNSGGPLLDSAGRLIGINTAILQSSAGFGFAIPVDTVRKEVESMSRNPLRQLPTLGVFYEQALAMVQDRETGESRRVGVRILTVFPNGPAEKAGLQGVAFSRGGWVITGDIILAIGNEVIDSPEKVTEILARHQSGDQVILTILRQDQAMKVPVLLQ